MGIPVKETSYVLIDLDPGLTLEQECTPTKWIIGIFCPLYHKDKGSAHATNASYED
jgi:hypothetical protein